MGIRFGCQAYTWQMSGRYVGRLDHILSTVQAAGLTGFETEVCMLGRYYDDAALLANELQSRGIEPAALTLALPWAGPEETPEERREADRLFAYLAHFPGTMLVLAQLPGQDRADLQRRQQNALACFHAIGRRARERGIVTAFHPNSPPGSIFRTWEDYQALLAGLDADLVGLAPDAGHIAKGGMDAFQVFQACRPWIRHVHFKDLAASGQWAAMGQGMIDFPGLVSYLRDSAYDGWIMVEEESAQAEAEPDVVTLANGRYVRETLLSIVQ